MPSSSNASFIPKYNTNHKEHRGPKRQVFIGTLIVRILFFAVLVAAVFVFFYSEHLKSNLEEEVVALDAQIANFNDADLERVLSVDARLSQATAVHTGSVSFLKILTALETTLVNSAYLGELSISTNEKSEVEVTAKVITPDFDSTLFQQGVYEKAEAFSVFTMEKVAQEEIAASEDAPTEEVVTFGLEAIVDPELLRQTPVAPLIEEPEPAPVPVAPEVIEEGAISEEVIENTVETSEVEVIEDII